MTSSGSRRVSPAIRLVLAAGLLFGGCAPGPTGLPIASPGATGAPSEPAASGDSPAPGESVAASPVTATVRAYLVLGFGRQTGLVPVLRQVDPAAAGPETALDALLAGPSALEQEVRIALRSGIPTGTRVLGLAIDGGRARVDLSSEFEAATEDELPTAVRIAQVVYTLTHFPGIESVEMRIEGALVTVLGPDRFPLDGPVDRLDFTDVLPALFIDDPAWGATIASPVRIAGLANAFEATFQIRIADAEGRGLAAGPVTATCGTGCWGSYEVLVPFSISAAGPGVLQAFELSPRDGGMDNLREYPVWLTP